jgi:hypothetical protein
LGPFAPPLIIRTRIHQEPRPVAVVPSLMHEGIRNFAKSLMLQIGRIEDVYVCSRATRKGAAAVEERCSPKGAVPLRKGAVPLRKGAVPLRKGAVPLRKGAVPSGLSLFVRCSHGRRGEEAFTLGASRPAGRRPDERDDGLPS